MKVPAGCKVTLFASEAFPELLQAGVDEWDTKGRLGGSGGELPRTHPLDSKDGDKSAHL